MLWRMLAKKTIAYLAVGVAAALLLPMTIAGVASAQTPDVRARPTPTRSAATPSVSDADSVRESTTPTATPEAASEITHSLVGRGNCLICHADGFRGAGVIPDDHVEYSNDDCQECHEPVVVVAQAPSLAPGIIPTPIAHPTAENGDSCFECHVDLGEEHTDISQQWEASVHGEAGIGCADCHGGDPGTDEMNLSMDPSSGFIGAPSRLFIPGVCGGCHSDVERMRQYNLPTDQYSKYMDSVHGVKLSTMNDTAVALCTDCHGTHDVKKISDPTAEVYPLNVPAMCARCHSDAQLMEPYGIPTDQFEVYETSVHGEALLVNQDMRSANCASCHGSHAAQPPDDEEVINVCGKCHTATQAYYEESLHARIGDAAPKCWTCHGTHDVPKPDESMFIHPDLPERPCGTCHLNETEYRMDKERFADPSDRRCDTCHHEGSMIMVQVTALHENLAEADTAFREAEETIQLAMKRGMIVTEAEAKLADSRTKLISARAALHTTKLPLVTDLTDAAQSSASSAHEIAAKRLEENIIRRMAMAIAIGAIGLNVAILYSYKRKLYKQLE